jgi:hypothetical protein
VNTPEEEKRLFDWFEATTGRENKGVRNYERAAVSETGPLVLSSK